MGRCRKRDLSHGLLFVRQRSWIWKELSGGVLWTRGLTASYCRLRVELRQEEPCLDGGCMLSPPPSHSVASPASKVPLIPTVPPGLLAQALSPGLSAGSARTQHSPGGGASRNPQVKAKGCRAVKGWMQGRVPAFPLKTLNLDTRGKQSPAAARSWRPPGAAQRGPCGQGLLGLHSNFNTNKRVLFQGQRRSLKVSPDTSQPSSGATLGAQEASPERGREGTLGHGAPALPGSRGTDPARGKPPHSVDPDRGLGPNPVRPPVHTHRPSDFDLIWKQGLQRRDEDEDCVGGWALNPV